VLTGEVVMILRAAFWIALVSLLMPREPDLGLGRPGSPGLAADTLSLAAQTPQAFPLCRNEQAICAYAIDMLASLRAETVRNLARVKAEIEAQQHARSLAEQPLGRLPGSHT
jgi:hypothetical protein